MNNNTDNRKNTAAISDIKRHPDGSIDSNYYILRGRAEKGLAVIRICTGASLLVSTLWRLLILQTPSRARKNCKASFTTCKSLNTSLTHNNKLDLS